MTVTALHEGGREATCMWFLPGSAQAWEARFVTQALAEVPPEDGLSQWDAWRQIPETERFHPVGWPGWQGTLMRVDD